MKKILLVALLILMSAANLPADEFPYKLDLTKEAFMFGGGALFYGAHLYMKFNQDRDSAYDHGLDRLDKDDINFVDRSMMRSYSRALDMTGHVLLAATMLAPFSLAIHQSKDTIITEVVMYAETLLLAHSFKELSKDKKYIDQIIKDNTAKANYLAQKTLSKVQKNVGFPPKIR